MTVIKNILISVLIGITIGVVAAYGDTLFNDGQFDILLIITSYFNTPTLWAMSAFFVGTISRSRISAAALAMLLLLSAVFSYYLYGITLGNRTEILMSTIFKAVSVWSLLAVIIGPVYGIAGSTWRYSSSMNSKMTALLLLPVLIISENGYYLFLSKGHFLENISVNTAYLGMILVGLSLPFFLLKDTRRGFIVSVMSVFASILGIAFLYFLFDYVRSLGV